METSGEEIIKGGYIGRVYSAHPIFWIIMNRKENIYIDAAALTLATTATALLTGGAAVPAAVAAGVLGSAGNVLGNIVAGRIQQDQHTEEMLASALSNRGCAEVVASAIKLAILSTKRGERDKETQQLAELASTEWLRLQDNNDPQVSAYGVSKVVERVVDHLSGDLTKPLILMPAWVDILAKAANQDGLTIDHMRLNEVAGALCRDLPQRLHQAFIADFGTNGTGFADLALRLFCEIAKSIQKINDPNNSVQVSQFGERLDNLFAAIQNERRISTEQADEQTRAILEDIDILRESFISKMQQLQTGQDDVKQLVKQVLENQRRAFVHPQQNAPRQYESALAMVAAMHTMTPIQLQSLLAEYARSRQRSAPYDIDTAKALLAAGDFKRAEEAAQAIAVEEQQRQAAASQETVASLTRLIDALEVAGVAALQAGRTESTVEYLKQAASLTSKSTDLLLWFKANKMLALALLASHRYLDALPLWKDVIETATELSPISKQELFELHLNTGWVMTEMGNYALAEHNLVVALSIGEKAFPHNDERIAALLQNLAVARMDAKRLDAAEEAVRKCIGLLQETGRLNTLIAGSSYYILAKIMRQTGRYKDSFDYYKKSLTILEAHLPANHPSITDCINELGLLFLQQQRFLESERYFRIAVQMAKTEHRPRDTQLSMYLANLGKVCFFTSRPDEARIVFECARKIRVEVFGADHATVRQLDHFLSALQ